jgi:hypothetical protein
MVIPARVCVEDGGVNEVAAADWRGKCCHISALTPAKAGYSLCRKSFGERVFEKVGLFVE